MEINQLKYFKAVAETGKIVSAAEMLFVTPPAVSTSLSGLERELGMPLFERQGKRLVLNRQGEIFLEYANHILFCLVDAQNDLMESLSEASNHINVAMTSANLWVDLITAFSLKYPGIFLSTASINVKNINDAGLNSRFSFLLAAEGDAPADYESTSESIFLFEDTPVLMVSPEHPFAGREMVEPEELVRERLIWSRQNFNIYNQIRRIFDARDLPAPVFSTHMQQICQTLVSQNAGVALTTAHAQNNYTGDLCYVPLNAPECHWSQRMYWRKSRRLTVEALTFIDFVKTFYQV